MITIKCFGNVEIEGNGNLPAEIKLVANGDVRFINDVVMSESDITCFASIKEGGKE